MLSYGKDPTGSLPVPGKVGTIVPDTILDRYPSLNSGSAMKKALFTVLFCLLLSAKASAQAENIRIDAPGGNPEEVTIAINPTNPDNLVAGANLRYVFHSMDGGRTWEQNLLPQGTWGDPCVIFDKDGRAYMANLTYGWDAITVRHSDDGGATWSEGVKLFGPSSDSARPGSFYKSSLQDKEWMIADMTDSPYSGNIYASWTDFSKYGSENPKDSSVIVFARSLDRGITFEPFVRISDMAGDCVDDDNTMEGAVPAVGPDGEVYIAWAGPEGLYFDRSFDGGVTFGEDNIISDMPGGWAFHISGISRATGLPITLADMSSSPHRGTVYVNWVDHRHGDPDVWLMRSTDRGDTWSEPLRINDDEIGNGKEQFFTWATVDPTNGELSIVYYDRSRYSTDSTDVFLARSIDGGRSFTSQLISEAEFYPTPFVFFGDYNCIAAHGRRVRPIWTRLHDGILSIHTALIDGITGMSEPPGLPDPHGMLQIYPNPMTVKNGFAASVSFNLKDRSSVRLTVHDLIGRTVTALMEGDVDKGQHSVKLDAAQFLPGTYICRLMTTSVDGNAEISTKLITMIR